MKKTIFSLSVAVLGTALLSGCGDSEAPANRPAVGNNQQSHQAKGYVLSAEPADAKGVIALRQDAKDGEEVVVVGRIAGSKEPIVKGRAAFTIVDLSLEPCEDDQPWVMCCTPKEDLLPAMVMVKFVDDNGQTLPQDARQLLGVKEWNMVIVKGEAKRDAEGNLTSVVAEGIFIKQ